MSLVLELLFLCNEYCIQHHKAQASFFLRIHIQIGEISAMALRIGIFSSISHMVSWSVPSVLYLDVTKVLSV